MGNAQHRSVRRILVRETLSAEAADRIQRAHYQVGNLTIHIDYGDVVMIPAADFAQRIERRYTALTAVPAVGIRPQVAVLSMAAKQWLLYAIDLLADNRAAAPGLDLVAAVNRLIAHAPSATHAPHSQRLRLFPEEVLTASGWYEVALSRFPALTPGRQALAEHYVNPGQASPQSSTCPGQRPNPLDTARLQAQLPQQLTAYLTAHAPAAGQTSQPMATIRTIADAVQAAARRFFSPYAERGRGNPWATGWQYSAQLTSSQASPPSQDARRAYLESRARIVGNRGLFAQVHFDSRCHTDRQVLEGIVQTMEATQSVQNQVNAILQEISYTKQSVQPKEVVLDVTRPSAMSGCAARWSVIETLCHELLHVMVHSGFRSQARGRQVLVEGVTEILGDQLYQHIRQRAGQSSAYRAQFEAGLSNCPATIPAATRGYGAAGQRAENLRRVVGDRRFRAAYFLGRPELIGVQPKLRGVAGGDRFEQEADRVADAVVGEPRAAQTAIRIRQIVRPGI